MNDCSVPFRKVLVADDHPIIFLALTEMLDSMCGKGAVDIETVADGDDLLRKMEGTWDCLVLDMYMPGKLRSIPLLQAVRAAQPNLRIVVYTGAINPCLTQAALEEGASAYVSKASGPEVVVDALHAVSKSERFVDPAIDLAEARRHPWNRLTPGERNVLITLARGEQLQAIAVDSGRSYKTITAHKYNALRKLGLRSKEDIGQYLARTGLGYLLD